MRDSINITNRVDNVLSTQNYTNALNDWSHYSKHAVEEGKSTAIEMFWVFENVNLKSYMFYAVLFESVAGGGFSRTLTQSSSESKFVTGKPGNSEQSAIIIGFIIIVFLFLESAFDV